MSTGVKCSKAEIISVQIIFKIKIGMKIPIFLCPKMAKPRLKTDEYIFITFNLNKYI